MTKPFALAFYLNGERGIADLPLLQDAAAQHMETLLRKISANQTFKDMFTTIQCWYSRESEMYTPMDDMQQYDFPEVKLWKNTREFDLLTHSGTSLNEHSGTFVIINGDSDYCLLKQEGLQKFLTPLFLDKKSEKKILWFVGHAQSPETVLAMMDYLDEQIHIASPGLGNFAHLESRITELRALITKGDRLTPLEVERALSQAKANAANLDLIVLESCQSCSLEVMSVLTEGVNYCIASQTFIWSLSGWNYTTWPSKLAPSNNMITIAKNMVDDYISGKTKERCLSLIDLKTVPELLKLLKEFTQLVLSDISFPALILAARKAAFLSHTPTSNDWLLGKEYVDVCVFFENIITEANKDLGRNSQLANSAGRVLNYLNNAVILKNVVTNDFAANAKGLSIWFPCEDDPMLISGNARAIYKNHGFAKNPELTMFKNGSDWPLFIKAILPACGADLDL